MICDDVCCVKFDFELYLFVVVWLGLCFEECFVVEDFFNGVIVVVVVGMCLVVVFNDVMCI